MQLALLDADIRELKQILYGNEESEPVAEACAQLTQEFFTEDTMRLLIVCLPKLNFEVSRFSAKKISTNDLLYEQSFLFLCFLMVATCCWAMKTRKDATRVIANLQRQQVHFKLIASDYLAANLDLIDIMITG